MKKTNIIPQKTPIAVDVKAGKTYYWCACGRSSSQPFCDGSHKDTPFTPEPFTPDRDKTVHFCGCKQTNNRPLCDGTHEML